MAVTLVVAFLTVVALVGYSQYRGLQRYSAEAKRSGFKYVISPVFLQSIPWILFQEALLPLLQLLPRSLTDSWLPLSLFYRTWHFGYEPFAKAGKDTFMISSPSGNMLWTCDAQVVKHICDRRQEFIKPTEMLGMLNIYGPTLTASEGEQHLKYRKIVGPAFNEDVHADAWNEAIIQAGAMIAIRDGKVDNLVLDSATLALHVLSKALFNRPMTWVEKTRPSGGHHLTYQKAIGDVFKYNATLFMTPKPILNISPSETHKKARLAYVEFGKYLEEMRDETAESLRKSPLPEDGKGASLFQILVKAGMPEFSSSGSTKDAPLSPAEVLGNSFIFVLAGHETSANLLAHTITLLACQPAIQKALQADLDSIFASKIDSPESWTYSHDFPKLWNGYAGALLQEVTRLYPALPFVPKTNPHTQTIPVGEETYTIPANTLILINTAAAHRNPKYWPPKANEKSPGKTNYSVPFPASEFAPHRWLASTPAAERWNPPEGAHIPFALGFRSCMGSRFAHVEFCGALARIFAHWTVELEDGSPAGLKAAEEALNGGMTFEMGLKMGRSVPLRFVKRK